MNFGRGAEVLMSSSAEAAAAGSAAISRLLQMRQHWHDAASFYFEPSRFLLSLQSCITVSRTVTFIIQSHKGDVDRFEEWYAPHQEALAADATMVWVKDARNEIEK